MRYFVPPEKRMTVDGVEYLRPGLSIGENPWRQLTTEEKSLLNLPEDFNANGCILSGGGFFVPRKNDDHHPWRAENTLDRSITFFDNGRMAWRGVPGYQNLHHENGVETVFADAERVVIVSRLGQVECLDRRSGRSRWLYIFPTNRSDLSGPYAWDPKPYHHDFYIDSLRRYREETAGIGISGTVIDGDPEPPAYRIAIDPDPTDYYAYDEAMGAGFSWVIFFALILTVLDGGIDLYFCLTGKKPAGLLGKLHNNELKPSTAAMIYIFSSAMCVFGFMQFGRYSLFSYLALPTLVVLLFGMAINKLRRTSS
jgi:hypothetical protein